MHGGAGYIEETGAAQLFRDARVFAIYEGANGIQAIAAKPSKPFSKHLEKRLEIVTPHSQKQLS